VRTQEATIARSLHAKMTCLWRSWQERKIMGKRIDDAAQVRVFGRCS